MKMKTFLLLLASFLGTSNLVFADDNCTPLDSIKVMEATTVYLKQLPASDFRSGSEAQVKKMRLVPACKGDSTTVVLEYVSKSYDYSKGDPLNLDYKGDISNKGCYGFGLTVARSKNSAQFIAKPMNTMPIKCERFTFDPGQSGVSVGN